MLVVKPLRLPRMINQITYCPVPLYCRIWLLCMSLLFMELNGEPDGLVFWRCFGLLIIGGVGG